MVGSPAMLDRAYESIQRALSIDHAVMEGAARNGRVVMGSMDVGWSDLGSWSALLAAIEASGTGSVIQPGETVEVDARRSRRAPDRRPAGRHRATRAR